MNKSVKKLFSIFVAAALMLTMLSACGNNSDELETGDNTSTADTVLNIDDETVADTDENTPASEETTANPDEADPLALANEIMDGLREDLQSCTNVLGYNGEVDSSVENFEVTNVDGSVTSYTLSLLAPPFDTLDGWRAQMRKVFTDEHSKALEENKFSNTGYFYVYEGKVGFTDAAVTYHQISLPFASAELVSDTELVAKPTIPDDYDDIGYNLTHEVVFKKENGEWKIDKIYEYDDSELSVDGKREILFALPVDAAGIPPAEE